MTIMLNMDYGINQSWRFKNGAKFRIFLSISHQELNSLPLQSYWRTGSGCGHGLYWDFGRSIRKLAGCAVSFPGNIQWSVAVGPVVAAAADSGIEQTGAAP